MTGADEPAAWREGAIDPAEPRSVRERRLKIRTWRRGTKEMDLILGGYFDARGATLSDEALSAFEAVLREDDGVLYRWVTGAEAPPPEHAGVIAAIRADRGVPDPSDDEADA